MSTLKGFGFVNNAASNAANAPDSIRTHQRNELWFQLRCPSGVTGSFTLTGSLAGASFAPLLIAEGAIGGLVTSTITHNTTNGLHVITIANPVAAVNLLFGLDSPPPHVKIAYARSGGGAADGLYIDWWQRPV